MARRMTSAEKQRFRGYFPRLDVNRAVVTGNATRAYNCIAWTVGVTSRWIWPGSSISNFDSFYRMYGLVRSSNGPIAAWGHNSSNMTHACVARPGWESKCGGDLRIQHRLGELVGSSYGRVGTFYKRRSRILDTHTEKILRFVVDMKSLRKMRLHKLERELLTGTIKKIDPDIRKQFAEKFLAWKNTWTAEHTAHLSDPSFVRFNKEFGELISLGDQIIPLLIKELLNPNNFFALQLYDAIQPETMAIIPIDPEDEELILDGEQGRANRTVRLWLSSQ